VVSYRPEGNTHVYFPLISKKEYSKKQLFTLMHNYFNNSFPQMATFFARENDLTIEELGGIDERDQRRAYKTPENE
jgi:BlaI family transcriptional regulator, penicillinase repressor